MIFLWLTLCLFQFKISITTYSPSTVASFPKARKGSTVCLEDLQHVSLAPDIPEDCAIQLLVGITASQKSHVLRLRWPQARAASAIKPSEVQTLFRELTHLLPKGGHEAMRQGGSSGESAVNANLFKFLATNTSFPRKAQRVKLIQRQLGWDAIYVKPYHPIRKAIKFSRYCQPQPGGSFHLPPKLLLKYPVLLEFVQLKIYTAQILKALQDMGLYILQPLAVQTTLQDLAESQLLAHGNFGEVLFLVSSRNMYSMVCYPVGYHIDTFQDNKASLENKICFVQTRWKGTKGCGRGGSGANQYVWALLDWTSANTGQRRRAYLAMGGSPAQRVTDNVWETFLLSRE